ncbi:MAG: protein kinase [Mariniblastus sp.]|nr:protein kinase [Mariniblastus sp.]
MPDLSAEQLSQRAHECRLLETAQLDRAMSAAGGRGTSFDALQSVLLQQEYLTNWQIQRLIEGHRRGYFYGSWKVLYLVGAGTFARVYRAAHQKTGDIKAVKVLRNRYATDVDTRDRFMREARMVMRLRHPNIVPIHEVAEDRGRTFMVMDFIEGQNLRDFVKAHNKIKRHTAIKIIRDLGAGLDYAFKLGISHRDMKLSNVLLSTSGQAKIVDFGLAAVNTEVDVDAANKTSFNPRSIDYAGLEKTTNVARNDARSDVYFLGCILYHMLTGQSPLLETRERIKRLSPRRYREIVPITNLEPDMPHRLVILVNRLMELDPEKRPQTPGAALREIDQTIDALDRGKNERYDPQAAQQDAEHYAKITHREIEGDGKTVMVIESNQKIQNTLREKLKNLGYRVLVIGDPQRALVRFSELDPAEERPADCVIFGCSGLGYEGIQAFNMFADNEETAEIPALLLLTAGMKKYLPDAKISECRLPLDMPLKFKLVRKALNKLLANSTQV